MLASLAATLLCFWAIRRVRVVETARAAVDLSRATGVPMPISEQVYRILHEGKDVRAAVSELFARSLKMEKD